jgi:hypothetical protein
MQQKQQSLKKAKETVASSGNKPDPSWIRKSKAVVGRRTKEFISEHLQWGMFLVVAVMRAFLPDVFISYFEDIFQAKEVFSGLLRVVGSRNNRAHSTTQGPTEGVVLDALHQMLNILTQYKCKASEKIIENMLKEAMDLVQKARNPLSKGILVTVQQLNADAINAQQYYETIISWEAFVTQKIAKFYYQDGKIAFDKKSIDQKPIDDSIKQLLRVLPSTYLY